MRYQKYAHHFIGINGIKPNANFFKSYKWGQNEGNRGFEQSLPMAYKTITEGGLTPFIDERKLKHLGYSE